MASSNGNLLGEPFKDYVNDQIIARQKVHGKKNRTLQEIQYLNSRNAWVKLASGVFIEQERLDLLKKNAKKAGGNNSLLQGVNEGMELALQNVLFNGLSSFGSLDNQTAKEINNFNSHFQNKSARKTFDKFANNTQQQRSGIKGSNRAYGVGGTPEYGYSPMPGIVDASIRDLNRGSIKKATINLKCHNRAQFDVIDVLYMRLGYTVLLEWGNDKYLSGVDSQGNGKLAQMETTLADKEWFQYANISYEKVLPAIEALRRKYHGNYDGIFGTVSNFSWTFNDDGSYDVKLELISQGDIIESLKANLPVHEKTSEENNSLDSYQKIDIQSIKDRGALNEEQFYDTLYSGDPGLESILDDWWRERNKWGWKIKSRTAQYTGTNNHTYALPYLISDRSGWDFPNDDNSNTKEGALNAGKFKSTLPDSGETKGMAKKANEVIVSGKGKNSEGIVEQSLRESINNLLRDKISDEMSKNLDKPGWSGKYIGIPDSKDPFGKVPEKKEGLEYTPSTLKVWNKPQRSKNVEYYFKKGIKDYVGYSKNDNLVELVDFNSFSTKEKEYYRAWLLAQIYVLYNCTSWDDVLLLIKNEFRNYFKENLVGGGPESVYDENNQSQTEETNSQQQEETQSQKAQIDNQNELEANKFNNKTTLLLFQIRKYYKDENFQPSNKITIPNHNIGENITPFIKQGEKASLYNEYCNFPEYKYQSGSANPCDIVKMDFSPLDNQFFMRIGTLLEFIETKIIPKIDNKNSSLPPILKIDYDPNKNICYAIDNMISLNPNKIISKNEEFFTGEYDSNNNQIKSKIYDGLNTFINNVSGVGLWGNPMNLYMSFNRIEELFDDVDEKNQVSVFSILKNISDDINECLGNVNNIEPIIDKETNTVKFIDQTPIPNLKHIANFINTPFPDWDSLPTLEIFGFDNVTPNQKGQSTFVRKAGITTSITKEYATIISIGATANGAIPGAESTAFSNWNKGIKDRFKNNIIDGEASRDENLKKQNEEVLNKYNTFISKPTAKLGLMKTDDNYLINNDYIKENKNRAQNYYIYAQAEASKNDGNSIESSIGFLPFNLKLEMDGLSGFKIYNRVKVNTSFLPSNYGNTLDFIITGVNHKLSNNEWVTDLETIATTKDKST